MNDIFSQYKTRMRQYFIFDFSFVNKKQLIALDIIEVKSKCVNRFIKYLFFDKILCISIHIHIHASSFKRKNLKTYLVKRFEKCSFVSVANFNHSVEIQEFSAS